MSKPVFKPLLDNQESKDIPKQQEQVKPQPDDLFATDRREYLGHYHDFIGVYNKILPPEFCKMVIEGFDTYQRNNATWQEATQFPQANAGRMDWAMDLAQMAQYTVGFASRDLNDVLIKCLDEYIFTYGHLNTCSFYTPVQKVQKTPAGGGYHVWHDENSSASDSTRKIVWMFYLNDNYGGGETEFLYYKKRIQPEAGTLLIWPAGLTHCHRGGLVTDGTKYVITGWFYIMPQT